MNMNKFPARRIFFTIAMVLLAVIRDGTAAAPEQGKPSWTNSHQQTSVIRLPVFRNSGTVNSFCVDPAGNLLVCWAGRKSNIATGEVKIVNGVNVVSPDGTLIKNMPLEYQPEAIAVHPSGKIVVGGQGRLTVFNPDGSTAAFNDSLAAPQPPAETNSNLSSLCDAFGIDTRRPAPSQRQTVFTGLAITDADIFVAGSSPKGFGSVVHRFDHALKESKLIVRNLSGCCGQMDIAAGDGKLWVAHNGRHAVDCFDREGKKVASFGKNDQKAADGFGGCCEPKNIRCRPNGEIVTAESGPPVAIKRFNADGRFLGVVAKPNQATGCVRVTVDVSPDGSHYYLLNGANAAIHVFGAN